MISHRVANADLFMYRTEECLNMILLPNSYPELAFIILLSGYGFPVIEINEVYLAVADD